MSDFKHQAPVGSDVALVSVIMGSRSDWPTMKGACETLDQLKIPWQTGVISAHRTPERMFSYARLAESLGIKIIIAGAGGAAHLPGIVAGSTVLPVLGVPVESKALKGMDSLLSIVQMPRGVPTATFSIGEAGAINAALFAARILSLSDNALMFRLKGFIQNQTDSVPMSPYDEP